MPTVLILGATSDMAMAIARKFASAGYQVQLAARKPDQLKALQADIQIRYNAMCTLHQFDALDYNSHERFLQQLEPKPDVAICVFGYLGDAVRARDNWDEANRIIQSNYIGAVSVLDKIANQYAANKKGTIVG